MNEQTEPGRTDERTNQPGRTNQRTNEPTNQPGTKRTNESVTHSTAQPYEATLPTLPLHMKQKKIPSLRTPRLRLRLPSPPRRYAFSPTAYAYPSRTCDCAQVLYDYAVPLALYPAKMYQYLRLNFFFSFFFTFSYSKRR